MSSIKVGTFVTIVTIVLSLQTETFAQQKCVDFINFYNKAASLETTRRFYHRTLEFDGFTTAPPNRDASQYTSFDADALTLAAELIADENITNLNFFQDNLACLGLSKIKNIHHTKYRPINGYGNNLKNPHQGSSGSNFGRLGEKTYADGVHSIRKSVSGSELPSPRLIVNEVYRKFDKTNYSQYPINTLINLAVLYLTHDMAEQIPTKSPVQNDQIRCCSSGNKHVLPPSLSHSACLPISVPKDDLFYSKGDIKCLNMVRSLVASPLGTFQYGEILNKATAHLDHSIIYGSDESFSRRTRAFIKGRINLGPKNIIPVDGKGNYVENRITAVPIGAIWPAIYARNHNKIADGLANLNPHWKDEKLFQEARRINIAIFQKITFSNRLFEKLSGQSFSEAYDESLDASTLLEFTTAAYRFLHYFVQPDMLLVDKYGRKRSIPLSDTIGRIDIVESNFDDILRGAMVQPLNNEQYSDELANKFAKNSKGFGLDIFSIDIQRGRDHGLPTYLETRRKCGLDSNYKSFDDLQKIFPKNYTDILKSVYYSVEDIDLIVGGALETFATNDTDDVILLGKTFTCIIGQQFTRTMGGDAYFFSHRTNPYPFSVAQLNAIQDFGYLQLICQNSNIDSILKSWFLFYESSTNERVLCNTTKELDLTPWLSDLE